MYTLNEGAVCWKSSKQDTIVNSTTKVEYIATVETTKEGVWIKMFIVDLGVVLGNQELISLYCDNNGAIAQARELESH